MTGESISVLEGDTFVVSDRRGDIAGSPDQPHGLFHQDTRILSRWRLTVDGNLPRVLSTDDVDYFSVQFFLAPPHGTVYDDASFSIFRKRAVGDGFHEDLTVINHTSETLELELFLEVGADFADLFEVKDALAKKGQHEVRIEDGQLVLGYRREKFLRETRVAASAPEAELGADGIRFRLSIPPQREWTTCLDVLAAVHAFGAAPRRTKYGHGDSQARPNMRLSLEEWIEAAPALSSDWQSLELTYRRSLIDLAALRFYPPILAEMALPAAGLPWFMAVFGRDSLITSYQALPYTPELAETTLQVLAARQGSRVDDFRDEEPGKILHELRLGELTAFEERPHSPYYGTADATPLFLVLLDEVERWTGNVDLVRELEAEARAALTWIDDYGDRDGDGYVEYERRNTDTGLENQCWKDSWNSILFADGRLASGPIATCEIQGYVYDAKRRCARLARDVWGDPALAARLEDAAAALKERFNTDFWVSEREFFALALDGDKQQVDSLTSNIGHLLWSGIVEDDKADAIARHLLGPKLFSGWGVRTMAEGERGYNPLGYHVGTVWPHDSSLVAAGLARYGYREGAGRIAFAVLEAAAFFRHRLPEVFAGYPRGQTGFPVEYPTACSPQAWASGAPLLFVTTLLGLESGPNGISMDPVLPDGIGRLELPVEGVVGARRGVPTHASHERRVVAAEDPVPSVASAGEFFHHLQRIIEPARTLGIKATYRFDVTGVGSWRLVVDDGRLSVLEGDGQADCILGMSEDVLLKIVRGEQRPATAFLTGLLTMEGDVTLAPKLDKLFSPARADDRGD